MDVEAHIEQLRVDGSRLATVVALAGPDASVRACPGWAVRDLVHHLGRVHRWATAFVAGGLTRPDQVEFATLGAPLPDDGELVDWYVAGHSALVEALAAAPADLECWSFLAAPSPLAFWARRQAARDGSPPRRRRAGCRSRCRPVPPGFAADGLDELLTGFVPRVRAGSQEEHVQRSATLRVACTDGDARWLVTIGPERATTVSGAGAREGRADCTVRGRAEDLYLVLWNRRGRGHARRRG